MPEENTLKEEESCSFCGSPIWEHLKTIVNGETVTDNKSCSGFYRCIIKGEGGFNFNDVGYLLKVARFVKKRVDEKCLKKTL